jgi:hypothetical protein
MQASGFMSRMFPAGIWFGSGCFLPVPAGTWFDSGCFLPVPAGIWFRQ